MRIGSVHLQCEYNQCLLMCIECASVNRPLESNCRRTYLTSGDFNVGYLQGSNVIRLRSVADFKDLWECLNASNSKIRLWCDGLSVGGSKRKLLHNQNQMMIHQYGVLRKGSQPSAERRKYRMLTPYRKTWM